MSTAGKRPPLLNMRCITHFSTVNHLGHLFNFENAVVLTHPVGVTDLALDGWTDAQTGKHMNEQKATHAMILFSISSWGANKHKYTSGRVGRCPSIYTPPVYLSTRAAAALSRFIFVEILYLTMGNPLLPSACRMFALKRSKPREKNFDFKSRHDGGGQEKP